MYGHAAPAFLPGGHNRQAISLASRGCGRAAETPRNPVDRFPCASQKRALETQHRYFNSLACNTCCLTSSGYPISAQPAARVRRFPAVPCRPIVAQGSRKPVHASWCLWVAPCIERLTTRHGYPGAIHLKSTVACHRLLVIPALQCPRSTARCFRFLSDTWPPFSQSTVHGHARL
jgi:hypothetical protein